jgi:hypothetical protein
MPELCALFRKTFRARHVCFRRNSSTATVRVEPGPLLNTYRVQAKEYWSVVLFSMTTSLFFVDADFSTLVIYLCPHEDIKHLSLMMSNKFCVLLLLILCFTRSLLVLGLS